MTTQSRLLAFRVLTAAGVVAAGGLAIALFLALRGGTDAPVNLDLTLVESDETALPFYELVFDYEPLGDDWNFADPYLRRRGKPLLPAIRRGLLGPHDVLGFRNTATPARPDIVVIGDSQVYGINARIHQTWPARLAEATGHTVYNMSMAGWGGLSYLYMASKAVAFRPRLILVALYMGNDSVENVMMAYGGSYWEDYRPRPELAYSDIPLEIRAREHEIVEIRPGVKLPFQTAYRFDVNNPESVAVSMGYKIQERAVREIVGICSNAKVAVAFTIIPTKELAFREYLQQHGIAMSEEYQRLVEDETLYREQLRAAIEGAGAPYIDLVAGLTSGVASGLQIYPESGDGHPSPVGYRLIAELVADTIRPELLPERRRASR